MLSPPAHDVKMRFDVPTPMRDGVRLSTDIYLPDADGPFPVVLVRTPYDNSTALHLDSGRFYARRGYVYAAQDCRGRYDSEGDFDALHQEAEDGHDTLEWIGAQEWCNGRVGMAGASYDGLTQWQAAPLRSRYLRAIAPRVVQSNFWTHGAYVGPGAFSLVLGLFWCLRHSGRTRQSEDVYDWDEVYRTLPLIEADRRWGRDVKHYQEWIRHPAYDDYWRRISNEERYSEMDVPALNMTGWFDGSNGPTFTNFNGVSKQGRTEEARRSQKLIIGPWYHSLSTPGSTRTGQIDFGPVSRVDLEALELRWFDYWLKGIDNGIMEEPPIRLFVMGENVWRDEREWPLARTEFTPFYLHSGGNADRMRSDGSLDLTAPEEEPPDRYIYDPNNPAPTLGGTHPMQPEQISVGPWDQRPIEARTDVLVYTSETLQDDMEVTGPVVLKLYASSSAPDTDFTARLTDVYPDGRSMVLCEGVIRARYRDSIEHPELMEPGTVYEFTIGMEVTSNLFRRGHRIRLNLSSSNYPRIDRNPNTGHPFGMDAEMRVAEQTVRHSSRHPSRLVLPVIPRVRSEEDS